MKEFTKALLARLSGDSSLVALLGGSATSQLWQFHAPADPKKLTRPVLVLNLRGWDDIDGAHGAALVPSVEVEVWGYRGDHYLIALDVMQRVDELFLVPVTRSETGDGSVSTRLWAQVGWQKIDEEDVEVVHLRAVYQTRYWNHGRVLAASS